MSYVGSEIGNYEYHEEIIAKAENIGSGIDTIVLTVDTTDIKNIDLMELRYRPDPAELPINLDILTLTWRNTNLKNNSGNNDTQIFPSREADGTYRYEPNHPVNLYYGQNNLNRHTPQKYSLVVMKTTTNTPVQTLSILVRLKVTKFKSTQMLTLKQFEAAILNAP